MPKKPNFEPDDGLIRTRQALIILEICEMGERDIRAGRVVPQDEVFRRLRERYASVPASD